MDSWKFFRWETLKEATEQQVWWLKQDSTMRTFRLPWNLGSRTNYKFEDWRSSDIPARLLWLPCGWIWYQKVGTFALRLVFLSRVCWIPKPANACCGQCRMIRSATVGLPQGVDVKLSLGTRISFVFQFEALNCIPQVSICLSLLVVLSWPIHNHVESKNTQLEVKFRR